MELDASKWQANQIEIAVPETLESGDYPLAIETVSRKTTVGRFVLRVRREATDIDAGAGSTLTARSGKATAKAKVNPKPTPPP